MCDPSQWYYFAVHSYLLMNCSKNRGLPRAGKPGSILTIHSKVHDTVSSCEKYTISKHELNSLSLLFVLALRTTSILHYVKKQQIKLGKRMSQSHKVRLNSLNQSLKDQSVDLSVYQTVQYYTQHLNNIKRNKGSLILSHGVFLWLLESLNCHFGL